MVFAKIFEMRLIMFAIDIALNTLQPHKDYVGIICKNAVCSFRYILSIDISP